MVPMAITTKQHGRTIVFASLGLLAGQVLHDLDHVRQARSVEAPVLAIGIIGLLATVSVLSLAVRRDPLAPRAAVVVGFGTFLGFIAVHVLPDWGPLSDGYPDLPVDTLSWAIVFVPMAVALWLGLAGLGRLRSERRRLPAGSG